MICGQGRRSFSKEGVRAEGGGGVEGRRLTPASVIAAAVLRLEVLCWQAGRAVALPDAVGEEAFEGDGLGNAAVAAAAEGAVSGGEHGGVGGWWPWLWERRALLEMSDELGGIVNGNVIDKKSRD